MILVTGASGNNGTELIKRLSDIGAPVRGMVRRLHDRADGAIPGVEYVAADFDDPASIRRAVDGVDQAFLVTNSSERVEAQQLSFVQIARAAVEDAISSSGLAFTNLRPNLYMQGLLGFRPSIVSENRFFAPAGDARVSVVDVRDIAAVAAAALTESGHEGKTYDITGPEALTHADMALQLSSALGRRIAFVDVPEGEMRSLLLGSGVPPWQVDGLIEDYAHYRRGEAANISSAVSDVTRRPPRTFAAFARDYKDAFSQ